MSSSNPQVLLIMQVVSHRGQRWTPLQNICYGQTWSLEEATNPDIALYSMREIPRVHHLLVSRRLTNQPGPKQNASATPKRGTDIGGGGLWWSFEVVDTIILVRGTVQTLCRCKQCKHWERWLVRSDERQSSSPVRGKDWSFFTSPDQPHPSFLPQQVEEHSFQIVTAGAGCWNQPMRTEAWVGVDYTFCDINLKGQKQKH